MTFFDPKISHSDVTQNTGMSQFQTVKTEGNVNIDFTTNSKAELNNPYPGLGIQHTPGVPPEEALTDAGFEPVEGEDGVYTRNIPGETAWTVKIEDGKIVLLSATKDLADTETTKYSQLAATDHSAYQLTSPDNLAITEYNPASDMGENGENYVAYNVKCPDGKSFNITILGGGPDGVPTDASYVKIVFFGNDGVDSTLEYSVAQSGSLGDAASGQQFAIQDPTLVEQRTVRAGGAAGERYHTEFQAGKNINLSAILSEYGLSLDLLQGKLNEALN